MIRVAIIILFGFLIVTPAGGLKSAKSELDDIADKANENSNKNAASLESPDEKTTKSLARGFGDDIDWVTLAEAEKIAAEKKKPIFVLVHAKWCAASQAMKSKFVKSSEIKKLSKNFLMVNLEDDEEPEGENGEEFRFGPDGGYLPRVVFLNHDGKLMKEVTNPDEKYNANKYFYPTPDLIIKSMENVIEKIGAGTPREKDEL